jgi:hypothetical protein
MVKVVLNVSDGGMDLGNKIAPLLTQLCVLAATNLLAGDMV